MGHLAKLPDNICDVTDELEAAIKLKRAVRIQLDDGSSKTGHPLDLVAENHVDVLKLDGHVPVPVAKIVRVERL